MIPSEPNTRQHTVAVYFIISVMGSLAYNHLKAIGMAVAGGKDRIVPAQEDPIISCIVVGGGSSMVGDPRAFPSAEKVDDVGVLDEVKAPTRTILPSLPSQQHNVLLSRSVDCEHLLSELDEIADEREDVEWVLLVDAFAPLEQGEDAHKLTVLALLNEAMYRGWLPMTQGSLRAELTAESGFSADEREANAGCLSLKMHRERCIMAVQTTELIPMSKSRRKLCRKFGSLKITPGVSSRLVENIRRHTAGEGAKGATMQGANWLTAELERVFRQLEGLNANVGAGIRFFSVELLEKKEGDKSIAGEFGYTNGGVWTALTGFMDRDFSGAGNAMMYLLMEILKEKGIVVWDLGQPYDYKLDIGCEVISKTDFIGKVRSLRNLSPVDLTSGGCQ